MSGFPEDHSVKKISRSARDILVSHSCRVLRLAHCAELKVHWKGQRVIRFPGSLTNLMPQPKLASVITLADTITSASRTFTSRWCFAVESGVTTQIRGLKAKS